MSEKILTALIRLFALIYEVNTEANEKSNRELVESFLKRQFDTEMVKHYLSMFDEFVLSYHGGIDDKAIHAKKRASLNSIKILSICEQINSELQQEQKLIVLFQLLEFISLGKTTSQLENELTETVADAFNINELEFLNSRNFVFNSPEYSPQIEDVLIIDNKTDAEDNQKKHIYSNGLENIIAVIHSKSTNKYFFKFSGGDELFLNGQSILPARIYILEKGSSIRNPRVSAIYYSDIASKFIDTPSEHKVVLTAEDVNFRFKNSENGIHDFNFSEESGQLVGIMGGSGVGKSTLLNVLNGTLKPQGGVITINGVDIYNEKDSVQGIIGYIPQDDLLIEELSVFQNLYYCAKLCFDNLTESKIFDIVNRVLKDLDLYSIKELKVGGTLNKFISGGQRKRLNIALELIREPYILFVDEPTSGLSSMDSEIVMDLLKEQTLKGKLVIVNIHQPSSDIYKMFDKLIFMDKGGYPIYYGNPSDAVIYFKSISGHINPNESQCNKCGNVNPEQVLQIIESKVVDEYGKLTRKRKVLPIEWFQHYLHDIVPLFKKRDLSTLLPTTYFRIPGLFKQLKIFIIRDLLSKISNKQYMLISLLEAPVLAILLAYVTRYVNPDSPSKSYFFCENDNLIAYIFMSVVVALFLGLSVSAEEIIKDRKIRQREAFLNLSRFSYLNSKVFIMFLLSSIQTLSFVLVGNLIFGIKGLTFYYWLVLFSSSCLANMIGLTISSAFNSVITVYILIPFILVPQLIFSGVIVKFDKLNNSLSSYYYTPVIGDLMTSRWAFEALAVEQFKSNNYQKNFFEIDKEISNNGYMSYYYLTNLENKLNMIEKDLIVNKKISNSINDLTLLTNEIKHLEKTKQVKFTEAHVLTDGEFDLNDVEVIRNFLKRQSKFYSARYNAANMIHDRVYDNLVKSYGGKENFYRFWQENTNNSLSDLVLNRTEIDKIKEIDNRLVRLKDPIYQNPENNFGRAQMYSSEKVFLGYLVGTFYFNVIFIWLTALLLFIILYFDILRKVLEYPAKIISFKKLIKVFRQN